ncbi:MAG: hypothetical protein Q7K35_01445 [bacterium]|nr:hypothetical protein [bacterium]
MTKKSLLFTILLIFIAAVATGTSVYFYKKSFDKNIKPLKTERVTDSTFDIKPLSQVILMANKTIYLLNDVATATVAIYNPFPETKKWQIIYFFQSADGAFSELGQTKDIELKPGQTAKAEFTTLIYRSLPPGQYKIKTNVKEQGRIINAKSLTIEIKGTDKILAAALKLCADINCGEEKNIFFPGQTIYVKIIPSTTELINTGWIKFPDNNSQILKIQNDLAEIKLNKIGAYEVNINIKKIGYQELSLKKSLAVIAGLPEIKSASHCNGNGQCNLGETAQNCPQDCR